MELDTFRQVDVRQGSLRSGLASFLTCYDRPATLAHSFRVAEEAQRLALRFGADPGAAETAGLLHDVSAVIPNAARLETARAWGLAVLAEEEAFPMLLHQQLSAVLAREIFGISDAGVLSAIGCHTTLRAGSTLLDQAVFVADKLAWDQPGEPPYLAEMRAALEVSLRQAAQCYLRHLASHLGGPLHPWARAALEELE